MSLPRGRFWAAHGELLAVTLGHVRRVTGVGPVDMCHVTRYIGGVIRSFADKRTEQLWVNGTERRSPPDIARRAVRKLSAVDAATTIDDLRVPPGNRLHALDGDRIGQHAVSINDQWRVCFRFEDGDAYEVEVCDHHDGTQGRNIA